MYIMVYKRNHDLFFSYRKDGGTTGRMASWIGMKEVSRPLSLKERIDQVEQRITEACARSGRNRTDVNIIAVTKYVSLDMTASVLDHGLLHIGENRWQDAQAKWNALGNRGTWHFIGHLQTNKVRDVIDKFQYIHSLDRLSLAHELEKRAR